MATTTKAPLTLNLGGREVRVLGEITYSERGVDQMQDRCVTTAQVRESLVAPGASRSANADRWLHQGPDEGDNAGRYLKVWFNTPTPADPLVVDSVAWEYFREIACAPAQGRLLVANGGEIIATFQSSKKAMPRVRDDRCGVRVCGSDEAAVAQTAASIVARLGA